MIIHKEGYKIITNQILIILFTILIINYSWITNVILSVQIILLMLTLNFFRVPKRIFKQQAGLIYAPCDGKVVVIEETQENEYFKDNRIPIDRVISSQWCRCKETAFLSFKNFETKNFLNSFFSPKLSKNKNKQMKELKKYIEKWQSKGNLVLVTHYVVISEALGYASSSGEIVISDKDFKKIGSIEIGY